jgi:hypothetical protein
MTTREDRRMKKSHKLVAVLLVAVVTTLLVATTAHADGLSRKSCGSPDDPFPVDTNTLFTELFR